ncbi:MAG: PadR family transcriptional regulator [Pseudomonadota bacterium]
MSLPHILLGLLSRPLSGYDMQKECEASLSFFWSMNLSQVYPILRKLEDQDFVRSELVDPGKGPARRVYRRTDRGKEELADWLTSGPQVALERRHYLAQAFFLNAVDDTDKALTFFRDLYEIMSGRRDRLQEIERGWAAEQGPLFPNDLSDEEFFRHLVFDAGRRMADVYVEWCARCIDRLEARQRR